MFSIHMLCKECHTEKKYMVLVYYEHFRKQKHNLLFIKPKEKLFWNLRVLMCFFAVKCKSNYVRDFSLAKQGFFSCLFVCIRGKGLLYTGSLGYFWYKTNYVKVKSLICFHAHAVRAKTPRKQCSQDPRIYLEDYSCLWCLNSLNTQTSERVWDTKIKVLFLHSFNDLWIPWHYHQSSLILFRHTLSTRNYFFTHL